MKTLYIFTATLFCLSSCMTEGQNETQQAPVNSEATLADETPKEKKRTLSDIQIGMKDERVSVLLGKPDKVDIINPELGTRIEDWWYGKNQKVRMTGGQVTRIVKDVAKEQETLEKIRAAKERGDETEVKRMTDELKGN